MANPLAADLDHVLTHTLDIWESFRGQRLFLTGGTGFVGCWLLETFLWANDALDLGASGVVLTRNPEAFARKAPHLAGHPAIALHAGDVRSFAYPRGLFRYVIHAATESSSSGNAADPLTMLDTIVGGTRHTLAFARHCGAEKFLLTSSGAVYGPQPAELTHVPEDHHGGPDQADSGSGYAEGKRRGASVRGVPPAFRPGNEDRPLLCLPRTVPAARCPFRGRQFPGRRTPRRANPSCGRRDAAADSYLYAADLAIWLWTILSRGVAGRPYNVGCARAVTIAELAERVASHFGIQVRIAKAAVLGRPQQKYVPAVTRARHELGLCTWITLEEAIVRTARWHRGVSTLSRRSPNGTFGNAPDRAAASATVS